MKSIRTLSFAFALVGVAAISSAAPQYVNGELLFKVKEGHEQTATTIGLAAMGATELERYPQVGWVRVRYNTNGRTVNQAITALKRLQFVAKVEKNVIYNAFEVPNDPMIDQQWLVNRIELPNAWDLTHGDPAVKIAIIDTGVQIDHPDLAPNMAPGRDVVDNDDDPTPVPGADHGTHVAGIAAAATNNAIGVAGTGYDCSIMPIRAGNGGFSGADLVEAITWAADNGAHVINMSLGGFGTSQAIQDACNYALGENVLVVAAAGNHGTTTKAYPAAYPGVLAVANSLQNDSRNPGSAYGNWVHVTAPGTNILSTVPGPGYDGSYTGTSMSSPCVAGVAGLIWARGGFGQSKDRVFQLITDNCDPVPGNYTIFGRVNAYESVRNTFVVQQTHLNIITAEMFVGTAESGSLADLESQDGNYYTLITEVLGRAGSQGGLEMQLQLDRPVSELFDFRFNFATKSNVNCTAMFWLYNRTNNRWDFIKAFPTKVAGSTGFALVQNMAKYVDSDGVVLMRLRGHNPSGKPGGNFAFNFGIDFAELEASYEVQP